MPPKDIAGAFLLQALEDTKVAELAVARQVAPTTVCMLLQMVFEKLAKAFYFFQNPTATALRKHQVLHATKLLQFLQNNQVFLTGQIGLQADRDWHELMKMVQDIEAAHPQRVDDKGPQLEYPCLVKGQIHCPSDLPICHPAFLYDPISMRGAKLCRLAKEIAKMIP